MERLIGLLAFFGLLGAALWLAHRYLAPRLAKRESSGRTFRMSRYDSGGSDEPGRGLPRSHESDSDAGDAGGGDGGD